MINSRSTIELSLPARTLCIAHIEACRKVGIELLITSTYRDHESQAELYAISRTKELHRRKVTDAPPGRSWHNYRCAWDVVPLIGGKCVWDEKDPLWQEVIDIGLSVGAERGPAWEMAHFQVRPEPTFTLEQAANRFKAMGTIFLP